MFITPLKSLGHRLAALAEYTLLPLVDARLRDMVWLLESWKTRLETRRIMREHLKGGHLQ